MERLNNVKFIKSVVDYNLIGNCDIEVAFVGRSNVGKSSVINAVCGHKNLALTSQVPGKTRRINVFDAGHYRWIVDLPGYGYASGPEAERKKWAGMIEGYLRTREPLRMVYMIIDAYVGPTKLDQQMALWLQDNSIPYTIIANKIDKISSKDIQAHRLKVQDNLEVSPQNIYWVSAERRLGIPELVKAISTQLELH